MRQVLFNLLTNAINVSSPQGVITLRSTVQDGDWHLSLEDQGPGLSEAQRARIFERFVRISLPGVEYKGSGLGLAICRSIVGLHGGTIWAAPGHSGSGLCVEVEIPGTFDMAKPPPNSGHE
jgi:two-component system heavy metal sensor histidine kinase CusS